MHPTARVPIVAPVKLRHQFLWAAARSASEIAVRLSCQLYLTKLAEVPPAAVIVAPHRSAFDVPVGLITFKRLRLEPLLVVSERQLRNLHVGRIDWLGMNILPVSKSNESRRRMLELGSRYLSSNQSVAIMPEGRVLRDGAPLPSRMGTGAAELATITGRPIVILGTHGTNQCWRKGQAVSFLGRSANPVEVVIHKTLHPETEVADTHECIAEALLQAERYACSLARTRSAAA